MRILAQQLQGMWPNDSKTVQDHSTTLADQDAHLWIPF